MTTGLALVLLFTVATAVAIVVRWLRVPYSVALVIAGLILQPTQALEVPHLTQELLYSVFLPPLLFEAAFHLEFKQFIQNKLVIHSLAVPGVVLAVGLTAVLLTPAADLVDPSQEFTLVDGLVVAAILAATDPVAVVGLFRALGTPKRLTVLIEGESLINDGTGIVIFGIALAMATGAPSTVAGVLTDFARIAGGGILVGVVMGWVASKVIQRIDDPMIEITVTVIAAWGSFALAEAFHLSGVMATVTAGMLCGNYGARTGMSPTTRIATETFWDYLAFALNSVIFLLIGLEVSIEMLLDAWQPIAIAWLAVLGGRAIVVYGVSGLLRRTREKLPWSWSAVLTWGGLRGGLSMVLALALPADFTHRDLIITMTFGVVVLSILVQGLTMGPLLRRLGLSRSTDHRAEYDERRAELFAVSAALAELDHIDAESATPPEIVAGLRSEYRERLERLRSLMASVHLSRAELRAEEELAARRRLLLVEKETVLDAIRRGKVPAEVGARVGAELDARFLDIEHREETRHAEPPAPPSPPPSAGAPQAPPSSGESEGENGSS